MPERTISELMEVARTNPGALTPREFQFVRQFQNKSDPNHADKQYERHKERARNRQREIARAGQDIGPPHPPRDPARRKAGFESLERFCQLYFPARFTLAWSKDHLTVLARMQDAIGNGGLFALAMPRGSGKTTICEVACIWATITGRHPFVMLIAVSGARGLQLLKAIRLELLTNDLLADDWSEVCHPIHALDDRANRAKGQHIGGDKTHIHWRNGEIILPTVSDRLAPWRERPGGANGCVLQVAGITSGNIRGAKHSRPDGSVVRPSLVMLDDPQDDQSARSQKQCDDREALIAGAVLGQAGPGKNITAICPCTIIYPNDVASRLLNRDKNPLWTGIRHKMLYEFPEKMDLWDEYAVKRSDEFRNGGDGSQATAWYGERREEMDRGAVVAWPERHKPDELSAIQSAMNLFYADRRAFHAEYQNEPLEEQMSEGQLSAEVLAARTNGVERGKVPVWAQHLTAYIDVQKNCLWWLVAAWARDFTGAIIEYGVWPDQQRPYVTLSDVQRTLAKECPTGGLEATILHGLNRCSELLLHRDWLRQDGKAARIEKLLVDANWGESTATVYEFSRTSKHAAQIMPSHGKGITCDMKPMSEYQRKPGEQLGTYWYITTTGARAVRHVIIDTNWWKSHLAERLMTAMGDKGALTFFGQQGTDHRMLCDHLTAEYRTPTQGRGRRVDVWKLRPNRNDNHLLDCATGAAVAASLLGCSVLGPPPERKRVSYKELQEKRREFEANRKYPYG